MLTVHHLGISQSDRIVWLCEELHIDYELIRYERDPVTRLAPPEYRALHPFGTAPVITDGDVVLGESGAIIEYIITKYGHGRLSLTAASPNYAQYLFWFHFANGSVMPSCMIDLVGNLIGEKSPPTVLAALRERSARAFAMLEDRLGQVPYLAGSEFTAADIIMLFPLSTMRAFVPRDLTPYPGIRAYLARIAARPAYQTAMAKADPGFSPPMS
jgi:glutathione S-transferase